MNNRTQLFDKKERTEAGFTLIELVSAVSLMMLLTVLGMVGYGKVIENHENKATDLAAQSALLEVMKAYRDYDDNTTVETALEEWKQSYGKYADINVEAGETEHCIQVKATNKYGYIVEKEDGYGCDGTEALSLPDPEPERIEPNTSSTRIYTDEEIAAIEEEDRQYRNID